MDEPVTQHQYLVTVSGIGVDGYFATITGGGVSAATGEVWDGGADFPMVTARKGRPANITVSRPFLRPRDIEVVRKLQGKVGRARATVAQQVTDEDHIPIQGPPLRLFPNALLVGCNPPDADAASGEGSRLELEFAVGTVR